MLSIPPRQERGIRDWFRLSGFFLFWESQIGDVKSHVTLFLTSGRRDEAFSSVRNMQLFTSTVVQILPLLHEEDFLQCRTMC